MSLLFAFLTNFHEQIKHKKDRNIVVLIFPLSNEVSRKNFKKFPLTIRN